MGESVRPHVIETVDLTMIYKSGKVEACALRGVNLVVKEGEFVAVMGPSGCGKSTLLHLLGGLMRPTRGRIFIDGTDIGRLGDAGLTEVRRKKIGYVFQRFNLFPTLTAKGNIELAKKIHGNGHLNARGAEEILEMLGLKDKVAFRPPELSGGEQQRVAIARAVINQPRIILADEPTGSRTDTASRAAFRLRAGVRRFVLVSLDAHKVHKTIKFTSGRGTPLEVRISPNLGHGRDGHATKIRLVPD